MAIRIFYNPTVMVSLALMAVIVMMILPVPSWVVDIGLTASFALAILIFITTLFIERPLDFSAFPTALLASLMLRLSLNVSSTKLIIGQGHTGTGAAGGVIEGFAMFVMGGDLVLGIVIFAVLLIVNFIVITKGAGRMAEVGARFALDGMPGKQLAIDSDMAAGAIGHDEARERRRIEQEETTFFGSLDGASKFVKGDAVAGLLITGLNLVMGVVMGTVWRGMDFATAVQTYAVLTVGDGLVTQIPAVVISVASAILIAKGGSQGSADKALLAQLGGYPLALGTVAGLMGFFALAPGLPTLPFLLGAGGFAAWAWYAVKADERRKAEAERAEAADQAPLPDRQKTLGDYMEVDEIRVEFAKGLIPLVMDDHSGLVNRVASMRRTIAIDLGFIIPDVRLTDNPSLDGDRYRIRVQGVEVGEGEVDPAGVLVIARGEMPVPLDGRDVLEPVYGAPARWVRESDRDEAMILGFPVATPNEVIATHLMEAIRSNIEELVTRPALDRMIKAFTSLSVTAKAAENKTLFDEIVPDRVNRERLQQVVRALLAEQVSVRNFAALLEATAEAQAITNQLEPVVEYVRQKLGRQITQPLLADDGVLPLIQLSPEWEEVFRAHEVPAADGQATDIALPPSEINRLAEAISSRIGEAAAQGRQAAVVAPARRRRMVRTLLAAKGVKAPVLSFEEIGTRVRPAIVGMA
ncbi:MAG: flagellar biosynthesis protein FlhA [Alphaproteobacteria bacterium]|nr:flagellar biosynthesis protein FlhA [Alphaproteobacteria bacterium]MCB9928144.1 flagellar biosynthesis protein FlhA [Alphaproteobacteria bacterium]